MGIKGRTCKKMKNRAVC